MSITDFWKIKKRETKYFGVLCGCATNFVTKLNSQQCFLEDKKE
jgi:hypothetical protein